MDGLPLGMDRNNKALVDQAVSVLSVPYRGVSVKFKDAKNILKTPYTPTDNTDSTMLIGVILKSIDFHYFLNREDKKWSKPGTVSVVSSLYGVCVGINGIKNILKTPYTPTDNTDSTIFIFIWKNKYLVDSTFFFNINAKMGKGGSGNE